ncbi:MAG: polysaccharide deacetylase family protein [Dethiobacter sp.]|jgi:peptidoglycan/xylan/chitin deacetylase (PgdA/CDA1 family)|nr:polysaccharide deacetylase family protein [Dethiobacter sp.]
MAKGAGIILLILSTMAVLSLRVRYPAEPQPIYFAEGEENRVALTFESMWSGRNLDQILAILNDHSVRATFFITGTWLKKHPEAARSILAGGHEIGNHTMNHRILTTLNVDELVLEIREFNQLAMDTLEYRPRLLRPPAGIYNGVVLRKAREQGCRTVLWSVDSYDWISKSGADIKRRVEERVHQGAIIVFRIEATFLPAALPEILTMLQLQGYDPYPVSELLEDRMQF